jgi:hypothetical protein
VCTYVGLEATCLWHGPQPGRGQDDMAWVKKALLAWPRRDGLGIHPLTETDKSMLDNQVDRTGRLAELPLHSARGRGCRGRGGRGHHGPSGHHDRVQQFIQTEAGFPATERAGFRAVMCSKPFGALLSVLPNGSGDSKLALAPPARKC